MARISVSLSDELKARLEGFAEKNSQGVSEVVQQALEAYLSAGKDAPASSEPSAPPAPLPAEPHSPPTNPLVDQLPVMRDYLTGLAAYVDRLRNYVADNTVNVLDPPPEPFPAPPWWVPHPHPSETWTK